MRRVFLLALVTGLSMLPGVVTARPLSATLADEKVPAFAPGQILARFRRGVTPRAMTSAVRLQGATLAHRIAERTFMVRVPEGREHTILQALTSDPTVQSASLNYRITELVSTPFKVLKDGPASPFTPASQEPSSCISDVWMSTTQQGDHLLDSIVASETPQVYVFFEYADCELETTRTEIFFLSPDGAPQEIFDQEGVVRGSGIQGMKVQAWRYFEDGTFPVGRYLTIVSRSPEGGWDQVKSVSWRVSTFPDDLWFLGLPNYQWPLHSTGRRAIPEADIDAPQAWDITTGNSSIVVAIVSTGVKIDHPDLVNKIWTNQGEIPDNGIDDDDNGCVDDVHGCDFFNGEAGPNVMDTANWGTFSAGIAAAETNNNTGMAGVSWGAQIMPIKVLRRLPGNVLGGYLADMITAIDYAVANGARIVHLGPRIQDNNVTEDQLRLLRSVIDDAVSQGALITAGTGDTGDDSLLFPAGFDGVVGVGATDPRNQRTWFSSYGADIDLVAPGELILSTCVSGPYCIGNGTSLAAAHVGGVASLIWSVNPGLTPAEVRSILQDSATDLGTSGYDVEYGWGKLNAAEALALTPHRLGLQTSNLDDHQALVFLVNDEIGRACQRVWNPWTGPQSWIIRSDNEWLIVGDRSGARWAPVPSDIEVCVDAGKLSAPGSFEATLEAESTLPFHQGPVTIRVNVIYQSDLDRVLLSFIRRRR